MAVNNHARPYDVKLIRSCVISYRRAGTKYGFRTAKHLFLLPGAENSHARPYEDVWQSILPDVIQLPPHFAFTV